MMMRIISLLMLFAAATAFTTPQPWGRTSATTSRHFMFSTDDEKSTNAASTLKADVSPLATMDEPVAVTSGEDAKSVVRNMNTGEIREVKWVDPAMAANTNPLQMSWWAYIAFGFPFVVLANDVFHFLPTDGPIGFLGRL